MREKSLSGNSESQGEGGSQFSPPPPAFCGHIQARPWTSWLIKPAGGGGAVMPLSQRGGSWWFLIRWSSTLYAEPLKHETPPCCMSKRTEDKNQTTQAECVSGCQENATYSITRKNSNGATVHRDHCRYSACKCPEGAHSCTSIHRTLTVCLWDWL